MKGIMTRFDINRLTLIACTLALWMGLGLVACQIMHTTPSYEGRSPVSFRRTVLDEGGGDGGEGNVQESVNAVRFGTSCDGRPINGYVIGEGACTVLMLGGIHGDEPGGETLLYELRDRISTNPGRVSQYRIVIIPAMNPDGLETEKPLNANGVDLGRNFPAFNWGHGRRPSDPDVLGTSAGSEPETQAIMKAIKDYPPDWVITIQSSRSCIDYGGPLPESVNLAYALSRESDLAVNNLEAETGSIDILAGTDMGLPFLRMELEYKHKRGVIPPFENKRFTEALIRFLELSRPKEIPAEVKDTEDGEEDPTLGVESADGEHKQTDTR